MQKGVGGDVYSLYFCGMKLTFRHMVLTAVFCLCSASAWGQIRGAEDNAEALGSPIFTHGVGYVGEEEYEGERIPVFRLADVYCFKELVLKNKRQLKKYYKLVNNIKKVYPIAVDIQKTIDRTVAHLDSLPDKEARDEYMKRMEKELKKEYTPRLKKLTFSQGKLLIKLIDRQCDQTSFQLIKTYMGGFKAGFYNLFANLFGASLKKQYDPEVDDRLTERCILLIESGQI